MECHDCLELLYEYLDGELSEERLLQVRSHLATCVGCGDEILLEERFLEAVRDLCTSDAAPFEVRERIVIRLREAGLPPL